MTDGAKNIYILNFWYGSNYGASLTAYALYVLLSKYNNSVFLVDNMRYSERIIQDKMFSQKFLGKYCKITPNIKTFKNLKEINRGENIFFTGSDQVFRPKYLLDKKEEFLLDFVNPKSSRIAMSASFGCDEKQFLQENTPDIINLMRQSLEAFDLISVREKSGVDICRNIFNVDAQWIIDPVFQIDRSYYDNIANYSKKNYSNKIVSYIFDENDEHKKAYEYLEQKYDAKIEKIGYKNISMEDWLNAIRTARLVITNSFHGMCFALIFNKPFICLSKETGASARFEDLWEMLNIKNQSVNIKDLYEKDCIFEIDYESVKNKILEETRKGEEYITKALNFNKGVTQEKSKTYYSFLDSKITDLELQNNLKCQIKKFIREKWLLVFVKYTPKPIKVVISFLWHKIKEKA